ncbi:uncharacterized protein LOC135151520 [Daucus carota subsp. sativus]|uniref:uncharacterized protein LOC135151520 n=1 Tax=Daucus carota subsp. sativus TaxID=79200 RepID=UPI0030828C45
MKGILSRKLKLEDLETVALTEECSAVLQQKLPPKLKDPGSFTIPCTIGKISFDKCLCDLGASINLMPLSVFKKLGLPEPKPTNMYLQLADRSITYPRVFNAMKFPTDEEECFKVEPIEAAAHPEIDPRLKTDILERVLTGEAEFGGEEEVEQLQFLNTSPWKRKVDIPFESQGVTELKNVQEHLKPSIEEAPNFELKLPPDHLSDVQLRRI